MEIITFVLTVLGFGIAYFTYKKTYLDEPKEDKDYLIRKYDFADKTTLELIAELKEYMLSNHANEEHFMQGLTFQDGVLFLQNAHDALFTVENRYSVQHLSLGKKSFEDLEKRIVIHINSVQEIRTHLKFNFKKDYSVIPPSN